MSYTEQTLTELLKNNGQLSDEDLEQLLLYQKLPLKRLENYRDRGRITDDQYEDFYSKVIKSNELKEYSAFRR